MQIHHEAGKSKLQEDPSCRQYLNDISRMNIVQVQTTNHFATPDKGL